MAEQVARVAEMPSFAEKWGRSIVGQRTPLDRHW